MILLIILIIVLLYVAVWLINEGLANWIIFAVAIVALFSYHQHQGQQACLVERPAESRRHSLATGTADQKTKDCYKNNPYLWDIVKGHETEN